MIMPNPKWFCVNRVCVQIDDEKKEEKRSQKERNSL